MHKHCTLSSYEVPHKFKCIKLKMKSKITINKFGERKVGSGINHRPAYAYLPNAFFIFIFNMIFGRRKIWTLNSYGTEREREREITSCEKRTWRWLTDMMMTAINSRTDIKPTANFPLCNTVISLSYHVHYIKICSILLFLVLIFRWG